MVKLHKGKWVKFSNKIFPRYIKKHWTVQVTEKRSMAFNNWENAIIYEELIGKKLHANARIKFWSKNKRFAKTHEGVKK